MTRTAPTTQKSSVTNSGTTSPEKPGVLSAVAVVAGKPGNQPANASDTRSTTHNNAHALREILGAYIQTTKPGITKLVTITSMVGLAMALADRWALGTGTWSAGSLIVIIVGCIIGTALSAAGANALNQWAERERDARMPRTAKRPLPTGKLSPRQGLTLGATLSILGVGMLWVLNGAPAALIAALCVLIYLFLYTPMKAATWTATLVGAIPGALPPLIGWSAGHADQGFASIIEPGGMSLFWLMFIWQLPHFLAIAWMYRDDYELGGCAVLPVIDRSGTKTAVVISFFTILLVPATIAPALAMPDLLGPIYITTAALTGIGFGILVLKLLRTKQRADARRIFFASIIHLPLLLVVMVLDGFLHVIF